MKQCIIIASAILIVILLNIWQVNFLKTTSRYLLTDVNEIDNSVKREDYTAVLKGVEELSKTWEDVKPGWDIFGEHNDIEEISEHIESMKVYAKYQDKEELVNEYSLLKSLIEHVVEAEQLKFSNVL